MLRYLLIFLVVYLAIKLIQSFTRQRRKNQFFNPYDNKGQYSGKHRKEGDTTIHNSKVKKDKKIPKNEGDYIDFEEV